MNLISKFKSVSEAGDTNWKKKPGNFPAFINILTKADRSLFLLSLAAELPRDLVWSHAVTDTSPTQPWSLGQNSTLTPASTESRGTKKYIRRNQAQRGLIKDSQMQAHLSHYHSDSEVLSMEERAILPSESQDQAKRL